MPASYKIPQNVDLEDKILGPLTLKQFLFALAAGLATFVSFNVFYALSPVVFVILTLLIWGVAGAFIFVRPNDQPFTKFIFSFIWFATKPQRRVWKRIPSLGDVTLHDASDKPVQQAGPARPSAEEARSRLQQLAHLVDTRGWSAVDEEAIGGRITSGEAKPKLNIALSDSDQPEDILAAEDEHRGSDRVTSELDHLLAAGVAKPTLTQHKQPQPEQTA